MAPYIQNTLIVLLSVALWVAPFNGARRAVLSSGEEVLLCGALAAAWIVMLGIGVYWLLFP